MELVVIKGSKHDNSRKNRRRQVKAALKLEALNEWAAKREGSSWVPHIQERCVSEHQRHYWSTLSYIQDILEDLIRHTG